jgi:hypothetical protein
MKKFPAFYGTRKFIAVLKSASRLSLSLKFTYFLIEGTVLLKIIAELT